MDRQFADARQELVVCTRCHCPECERERALIWKMVEILIFEAGQARGLSHKVDPLIVAWKHKDLFRKGS